MIEEIKKAVKEWWADDIHWLPRHIRDWWHKRVGLTTYTYDMDRNEYSSVYVHMPKKDLPTDAVHVTGKHNKEYALDLTKQGEYPAPGTCTAIDLYLYMQTTAFDEALTFKKKKAVDIDPKYLVIVAVAVVALFLYMFMR